MKLFKLGTDSSGEFGDHVARLRGHIASYGRYENLDDPDERAKAAQALPWLQVIYERTYDHLENDMNRAWGILQIFLPLSFTPFAGYFAIQDPRIVDIAVLAAASLVLLVTANLFIDRLQAFQAKAWSWIRAIEAEIGLPQIEFDPPHPRGVRMREWRWLLFWGVLVMWLLLLAVEVFGISQA